MRMTSLASGSSGNCTLIQSDNDTHRLVDAGLSCKRIQDSLHLLGVDASDLSGIFITHEHSDHISGLKVLCKKRDIPIYGTLETLSAIQTADRDGVIDPSLYHPILPDSYNTVGELTIIPFSNTHDAANPVGYRIQCGLIRSQPRHPDAPERSLSLLPQATYSVRLRTSLQRSFRTPAL